jgi:major membrane immunogen (membrane-anchored lipoprotein)
MRKQIIAVLVLLMFMLSGCSPSGDEVLVIDPSRVSGITGTTQMKVGTERKGLSENETESFIELINSLELKNTGLKNRKKGWQYLFTVQMEDGEIIQITVADGKIVVNGYFYRSWSKRKLLKAAEGYFD